jgi:hypothetical protein
MTYPGAEAASCPQLGEGDIRALAEKSGFDPSLPFDEQSCRTAQQGPRATVLKVCGSRPEEGTS